MRRVVTFVAKDFGAFEDHALIVGFARDRRDEQTDEALILKRAKEGDEDTGIYTEIPPQRFSTSDGIEEAILGRDCFSVRFGPDASSELDDISEMSISFAMIPEEFASIAAMLRRIFRNHEGFRIDES
jgi:hypothetical protein